MPASPIQDLIYAHAAEQRPLCIIAAGGHATNLAAFGGRHVCPTSVADVPERVLGNGLRCICLCQADSHAAEAICLRVFARLVHELGTQHVPVTILLDEVLGGLSPMTTAVLGGLLPPITPPNVAQVLVGVAAPSLSKQRGHVVELVNYIKATGQGHRRA